MRQRYVPTGVEAILDQQPRIPVLQPIAVRPLSRPTYLRAPTLEAFVVANATELERRYDQMRAIDPEGCCSRRDFYAVQFDLSGGPQR